MYFTKVWFLIALQNLPLVIINFIIYFVWLYINICNAKFCYIYALGEDRGKEKGKNILIVFCYK